MELWIRSQDRKCLVEVNNLYADEGRIVLICKLGGRVTIATYSTQKRALEVLDEIQTMLSPKLHSVINKDGINIEVLDKNYDVYEMPLE